MTPVLTSLLATLEAALDKATDAEKSRLRSAIAAIKGESADMAQPPALSQRTKPGKPSKPRPAPKPVKGRPVSLGARRIVLGHGRKPDLTHPEIEGLVRSLTAARVSPEIRDQKIRERWAALALAGRLDDLLSAGA